MRLHGLGQIKTMIEFHHTKTVLYSNTDRLNKIQPDYYKPCNNSARTPAESNNYGET